MDDHPAHLRSVPPDEVDVIADKLEEPAGEEPSGLTKPLGRGNSAMFLTDVVVELGYASRERVDAVIEEARVAGRPADELLIEQRLINADQLSRAIAERYGLDHLDLERLHRRHGRGQPALGRLGEALPGGPGRLRRQGHPAGRDRRSGERARDRRHPDAHRPQLPDGGRCRRRRRGPDQAPQLARERGDRGRRRGRGDRAQRGRGAARVGRRRAGDQARLLDPRPGGDRGRLRHPLRAGRGRDAGALPRRRRPLRGGAGAARGWSRA